MQFEIIIIPTRQRFNFFQETEQSVYTFETPRLELAAPLSDDVTLHYPEDEVKYRQTWEVTASPEQILGRWRRPASWWPGPPCCPSRTWGQTQWRQAQILFSPHFKPPPVEIHHHVPGTEGLPVPLTACALHVSLLSQYSDGDSKSRR